MDSKYRSQSICTSLFVQPKLSVRSVVEVVCSSTSRRWQNSLWSSRGITRAWEHTDPETSIHMVLIKTYKAFYSSPTYTHSYTPLPLVCPCQPDILIHPVRDGTAPLQEMILCHNSIKNEFTPKRKLCHSHVISTLYSFALFFVL